jgi:hypothetical protein
MEDLLLKTLANLGSTAPIVVVMGYILWRMLKQSEKRDEQQASQMLKCAETLSTVSKAMEGMLVESRETKEMIAELQDSLTPRVPVERGPDRRGKHL